MSLDSVRAFFAEKAPEIAVIESENEFRDRGRWPHRPYGVEPARIAKTLVAARRRSAVVLIVASGHGAGWTNKKVKAALRRGKPKMLDGRRGSPRSPAMKSAASARFGPENAAAGYIATYRCKPSTKWCRAAGSTHKRGADRAECGWRNSRRRKWVDVLPGEAGGGIHRQPRARRAGSPLPIGERSDCEAIRVEG